MTRDRPPGCDDCLGYGGWRRPCRTCGLPPQPGPAGGAAAGTRGRRAATRAQVIAGLITAHDAGVPEAVLWLAAQPHLARALGLSRR